MELLLLVMVWVDLFQGLGLLLGFRLRDRQAAQQYYLTGLSSAAVGVESRRALASLASVPLPVWCVGSPPPVLFCCRGKHLVLCEACSHPAAGREGGGIVV